MNFYNAQQFVQKMRGNNGFRETVTGFETTDELWTFLKANGFDFNVGDLIKAMAACMAEMDQQPLKNEILP